jgi:quinol monooxygenase YgiN
MSGPIISIDRSEILEGKLEEVEQAIARMAAFVEAEEPDTIAYEVFLDPSRTWMTVVQIHPDSASMGRHLEIARPVFAAFAGLIRLAEIHVYGDPSPRLLEQLEAKAAALGDATTTVHRLERGFARLGSL